MPSLTPAQLLCIARQHFDAGRWKEAEGLCRKILERERTRAAALHLAGLIAEKTGRDEVAAAYLRRATSAAPENLEFKRDLERVSHAVGKRLAEEYFQATSIDEQAGAGVADDPMIEAAITQCAAMLAQGADDAEVCVRAAGTFLRRRYLDAAISTYRRALELAPNHLVALNNLGLALKDAGLIDQAISCFRQAMAAHPNVSACHGNLLYTLHFHPDTDEQLLLAEHRAWGKKYGSAAGELAGQTFLSAGEENPHIADPDRQECLPHHRLHIGYVSPNFSVHPVGRFMTSLLANHDHEHFEIFCYSSVRRSDAMTENFRRHADHWVDAVDLSDIALADRIREDGIDILVDLTMHMADSRLLTFAQRPAPIQVTYLAYCSITGLDGIDYRLSDPFLDPPGGDAFDGFEPPVRLPETYWCYDPVIETPPVNPLPALTAGHVTFANLNNFCKASPAALSLWAKLLHAVPNSRLILHAHRGSHRHRVRQQFAGGGVDPRRLTFVDMLPLAEYFKLYQQVDIALDPFPYPGGTTTCDALWMGVPVVSLVGKLPFTRSGLSILSNVGLAEFAVASESQYFDTAIKLAGDTSRLSPLRESLRKRMKASPLMDGPRFARDVESAYRWMWAKRAR